MGQRPVHLAEPPTPSLDSDRFLFSVDRKVKLPSRSSSVAKSFDGPRGKSETLRGLGRPSNPSRSHGACIEPNAERFSGWTRASSGTRTGAFPAVTGADIEITRGDTERSIFFWLVDREESSDVRFKGTKTQSREKRGVLSRLPPPCRDVICPGYPWDSSDTTCTSRYRAPTPRPAPPGPAGPLRAPPSPATPDAKLLARGSGSLPAETPAAYALAPRGPRLSTVKDWGYVREFAKYG
ncbi:hypothetical protein KM043_001851 [Ampulex compressa]|nr:hypothetical protein KM043_001851 [Ampulex compressa]